MEPTLRKHITLPKSACDFLDNYQRREGLVNFSAAVDAAVAVLKKHSLAADYEQFAADYAAFEEM